jgi:hypothetical protein
MPTLKETRNPSIWEGIGFKGKVFCNSSPIFPKRPYKPCSPSRFIYSENALLIGSKIEE